MQRNEGEVKEGAKGEREREQWRRVTVMREARERVPQAVTSARNEEREREREWEEGREKRRNRDSVQPLVCQRQRTAHHFFVLFWLKSTEV